MRRVYGKRQQKKEEEETKTKSKRVSLKIENMGQYILQLFIGLPYSTIYVAMSCIPMYSVKHCQCSYLADV